MGPESFFYFGKNSEITLHVPRQKNFANTSLSFKTETGSISIGNNEKDDFTVKNITADVGNGYFLFNSLADISPSASMNIKSQGGTVVVEGKLTMDQLNVESENSKITIHDIVGNVNITTKDSNVSVGNITGDLYYSADAGLLKSKNISGNFEASELVNIANIFVDEIGGKVLVPASKSSNIEIKKVCDNLRINTENGSVKIGEICANAEIITKNGSITCLVNSNQTSNIILTTESGNIDARYKNIDGTSTITTTRGKVYFQFASGEVFELAYSCDKNKPNVNSITTSDYSNSGSFAIGYDAESTCPNKVTITNKEGRSEFDNNLREDYDVFK
ncbi:MAG: DUF4097 family beta strand repeat protein, partial [Clostridia bacterium]|nr:DUF4097 family beta strand repeat protein [Clostridia bacterium]